MIHFSVGTPPPTAYPPPAVTAGGNPLWPLGFGPLPTATGPWHSLAPALVTSGAAHPAGTADAESEPGHGARTG
jgi:hypothetical protein